jgi:hypothetical protein
MPDGLPQATDDTWTYILDDYGVSYGPGWWPFHADRTSPLLRSVDRTPRPCGVRLAPNVAFYAWRTEYVSLRPTGTTHVVDGACFVVLDTAAPHGPQRVHFQLRFVNDEWRAERVGPGIDGQDILDDKIHRLVGFLRAAITERDAGIDRPATARDLHPGGQ